MIVRDNEHTIRACLESVRPWVDEMIVVDTGSRDATPDICRELGARVESLAWPDSFAEARNESLKYARGEWIFWMDSDDVIDAEKGRKLRELARRPAPENLLGYTMQVHCPGPGDDGAFDMTVVDHCKLFRNRPDLRFEGRIHEQVLGAINRAGGEVLFTDLFVVHAGADHTRAGRGRKLRRDLRLLRLERRDKPEHTFVHFNLGMTYADAGKHAKAIAELRRSRELAQPHESHVRKIYALLVASHRELGQRADAWQACREGLYWFPKDPELRFREGLLAHEDGRLCEAELAYLGALANEEAVHFGSIDRGIVGFKARQNLAAVYSDMGQPTRAEAQWRAIVADVPGYRAGWHGLVDNLIAQGRLAEAEAAIATFASGEPRLRGTGVALAARVAEAKGQLDGARELLRRGVVECPADAAPLEELCRILFDHGPAAEAEAALRELARRQPADGAAPHNLGTLLLRGGDAEGAVAAFRESLVRRPRAAHTHLSLGYALRDAGRDDDALAWAAAVSPLGMPRCVVSSKPAGS
ncbi:MAG TPA: glycosyltransferase [Pirellulales bacterium]|nr:glycosyltransferase [Pirellulales bacterium]